MKKLFVSALGVGVLFAFSVASADAPKGWFIAGNQPQQYESGIDVSASYASLPSAYLKAKSAVVPGFGTLMQEFRADHYLGKRIRFSAYVKSADANDWAGLWMRVDKGSSSVAFDNMHDRAIKGTSDWKRYEVVLDVPADATGIAFGVLLSGSGEVWLSDTKMEIVGASVLPTGGSVRTIPDQPINLDFKE